MTKAEIIALEPDPEIRKLLEETHWDDGDDYMTLDEFLRRFDELIASFDEPEPIVEPYVSKGIRQAVCVG